MCYTVLLDSELLVFESLQFMFEKKISAEFIHFPVFLSCISWFVLKYREKYKTVMTPLSDIIPPSVPEFLIFPPHVARFAWEPGPRCLSYPRLFLSLSLRVGSSAREWPRLRIGLLSHGFAWWRSPQGWAGATLFHRERCWFCCVKRVGKKHTIKDTLNSEQKSGSFYAYSHLVKWSKYYYSYYYNMAADKLASKENQNILLLCSLPSQRTTSSMFVLRLYVSFSALKGSFVLNHQSWGMSSGSDEEMHLSE